MNRNVVYTAMWKPNFKYVSANGVAKTYDGKPSSIQVTGIRLGDDVEFLRGNDTIENSFTNVSESGKILVRVIREGQSWQNYVEVDIDPFPVTITAQDNEKVHGELEPELKYTVAATKAGTIIPEDWKNAKVTTRRDAGEDVGEYDIRAYLAPESTNALYAKNYRITPMNGVFTIKPAALPDIEIPLLSDDSGVEAKGVQAVYDAEDHSITVDETNLPAGTTLSYSTDNGQTWKPENPSFVNAGTYDVLVKAENPNYEPVEAKAVVKITPFPVVVKANDAGKFYGQADPELTATVGEKPNDGIAIKYDVARAGGEVVAEYTILPYGDKVQGNGNYTVTYESGIFTILPAGTNVVTVSNLAGANGLVKTYDGQPASMVARAAVVGSTFQYSLDGRLWTSQNPSFTNAGTYTVYVRANAANYETTPAVSATVTINPRPVTITVNNASKTRGQADPVFTGAITAGSLVNADDLGAITYSRTNRTNRVGVYPGVLTANFADNDNYTITVVRGDFTVLPAVVPAGTDDPTPTPTATPGNNTPTTVVMGNDNPTTVITDDDTPMAEAPTTDETPLPEAGDAESIDENETPMAARATIPDKDVPLGAFESEDVDCWVHWIMVLGLVATAIYGIAVACRRLGFTDDLDDYEDQIMGRRTEERAAHVPADGRQAL